MANVIELITKYLPGIVDDVYKKASITAILDVGNELVRETADAKTVMIPSVDLKGLADYDKGSGFVDADVSLTWQAYTFLNDRGRSMSIDKVDNDESGDVVLSSASGLASRFVREKVVPELDAYRLATYYKKAATKVTGTLTKDSVMPAIETGLTLLSDSEAGDSGKVIFTSADTLSLVRQAIGRTTLNGDNNINNRVFGYNGNTFVESPSSRFGTDFTAATATGSSGNGGFSVTGAQNFLIVSPEAVFQLVKHVANRMFSPDVNQRKDAWKFDYRCYHDAWVYLNKQIGIYSHARA